MIQYQQSASATRSITRNLKPQRAARRRSHVFPLTNLRNPVLIEGTPRCVRAIDVARVAACLAGPSGRFVRSPLEFCAWDGRWRQFFTSGGLLLEFFWDKRPVGERIGRPHRCTVYQQTPDYVIVSRSLHLGPSDESLMSEAQVISLIGMMMKPAEA